MLTMWWRKFVALALIALISNHEVVVRAQVPGGRVKPAPSRQSLYLYVCVHICFLCSCNQYEKACGWQYQIQAGRSTDGNAKSIINQRAIRTQ
jgi:hypothetical protein